MFETFLGLMYDGGWMMWAILLLACLGVFATTERTLTLDRFRAGSRSDRRLLDAILERGALDGLAHLGRSPVGLTLAASARFLDGTKAQIAAALELEARRQARRLYHRLGLLGMVVVTAPLCGFLGTASGVLFATFYMADLTTPAHVAMGLAEALLTTVAGLLVAIPAQMALTLLRSWAEGCEAEIEEAVNRVLLALEHKA